MRQYFGADEEAHVASLSFFVDYSCIPLLVGGHSAAVGVAVAPWVAVCMSLTVLIESASFAHPQVVAVFVPECADSWLFLVLAIVAWVVNVWEFSVYMKQVSKSHKDFVEC